MPRKNATVAETTNMMTCFNEAGAVMPRKLARNAHSIGKLDASMRPGLLCPGRWGFMAWDAGQT